MKLGFAPLPIAPEDVTAESLVLAKWYDRKPEVRRLWGIRGDQALRVIVVVEPTPDGDDIYPVWFANSTAWTREIRLTTGSPVRLELLQEYPSEGIEIDAGCVVIADLFWRDATLSGSGEVR